MEMVARGVIHYTQRQFPVCMGVPRLSECCWGQIGAIQMQQWPSELEAGLMQGDR